MTERNTEKAALEARLAEIRAEEKAEAQARHDSVTPDYRYTLTRDRASEARNAFTGGIFDPACAIYVLEGQCVNQAECKAVGRRPFTGSMRYLFNGATRRFVCAISGGSIFVRDQACFDALAAFVSENVEGGDVTEIVSRYKTDE